VIRRALEVSYENDDGCLELLMWIGDFERFMSGPSDGCAYALPALHWKIS